MEFFARIVNSKCFQWLLFNDQGRYLLILFLVYQRTLLFGIFVFMIEKINEIDIDVFFAFATAHKKFEIWIKLSIKQLQCNSGIDSRLLGVCFDSIS